MLALADLEGMTEADVKDHLAKNYADDTAAGYANIVADLNRFQIIVAYESVGAYGCDSSSWFLLRELSSGKLYEFSGSHCSCYGFENQYDPEETNVEYLLSEKFYFSTGGYDDNSDENLDKVKTYLGELASWGAL